MIIWPTKSPGEIIDYAIDMAEPLAGDTIVKATWIVPPSIAKVKDGFAGNVCTIWLSGGKQKDDLKIIVQVETSGGRTVERAARLRIGLK